MVSNIQKKPREPEDGCLGLQSVLVGENLRRPHILENKQKSEKFEHLC